MTSSRRGKPDSGQRMLRYKSNRGKYRNRLSQLRNTQSYSKRDKINRAHPDLRHRSSRVVALFHGQQVVAAPLRERGNAAERDSESTARSRKTHRHTHLPKKSEESRRSWDDASGPTKGSSVSVSRAARWRRNSEKKDSLGRSYWTQAQNVSHATRSTRHQTTKRTETRANLSRRDARLLQAFCIRETRRTKSRNATARRKENEHL
jgi:hypothetical protein